MTSCNLCTELTLQHGRLVRAEVDDAVGDDEVDRLLGHAALDDALDVALLELHVGGGVPEGLGVLVDVLPCDVQLPVGHVQPDHLGVVFI